MSDECTHHELIKDKDGRYSCKTCDARFRAYDHCECGRAMSDCHPVSVEESPTMRQVIEEDASFRELAGDDGFRCGKCHRLDCVCEPEPSKEFQLVQRVLPLLETFKDELVIGDLPIRNELDGCIADAKAIIDRKQQIDEYVDGVNERIDQTVAESDKKSEPTEQESKKFDVKEATRKFKNAMLLPELPKGMRYSLNGIEETEIGIYSWCDRYLSTLSCAASTFPHAKPLGIVYKHPTKDLYSPPMWTPPYWDKDAKNGGNWYYCVDEVFALPGIPVAVAIKDDE